MPHALLAGIINLYFLFDFLFKSKKGMIFKSNAQILEFVRNYLKNDDYLMIKASNATGFNKIVNNLKD